MSQFKTQADCLQATLDGKTLTNKLGWRVKLIDGYLHTFIGGEATRKYVPSFDDPSDWSILPEKPKPFVCDGDVYVNDLYGPYINRINLPKEFADQRVTVTVAVKA